MDWSRKKNVWLVYALILGGCDREDPAREATSQRQVVSQGDASGKCKAALTDSLELLQSPDEDIDDGWSLTADESFALLAEPVTYDGQIAKLLANACVNCHKPGGDRPDLSTYALAKQNGPASLSDINRNRMPTRTPLAQADKDLFKAWSDAGFPQSAPPPAPNPAPAPAPSPQPSLPKVPAVDPPMPPPRPANQPPNEQDVVKAPIQKVQPVGCK